MNTSINNFDAIEKLIFEEGIRIKAINFHPEMDLMLVLLNTQAVLHQKISAYPFLQKASKKDLEHYEFIGGGTGIHWISLDEDLSLKSFLRDELKIIIGYNKKAIAI